MRLSNFQEIFCMTATNVRPFRFTGPVQSSIASFMAAVVLGLSCLSGSAAQVSAGSAIAHHPIGLGKVLTTKDGGRTFGFDINQGGDDGVLASAQTIDAQDDVLVSMESLDQKFGQYHEAVRQISGSAQ
jgi:hypothetical protein